VATRWTQRATRAEIDVLARRLDDEMKVVALHREVDDACL
jgi:hypothetical protein